MSYVTTPDGVRLRTCDRGDGERTIVLVHGWKMSHRIWDHTIAGLVDRFRVAAFDLRGMGESDKPKGSYDFGELAGDLGFVICELGLEEVTLVGWSMGCTVSLEYLRRGGAGVAKLVLVNGPIKLTATPDFPWTLTEEQLEAYLEDVERRWPSQERRFTREAFREPHEDVVDWIYHIALQTPLDVVLRVVRHQAQLDYRDFLPQISVPTLAVYGRYDPYYPVELAAYIAGRVPRGEQVIFERSAHFVMMEEAERFESVLAEFSSR